MNRHEVVLFLMVTIHVFVWLFVYFSWLGGKHFVIFNTLILLPIIYLVQSMPCHAIIYMKLKHIIKHLNHLRQVPEKYVFSQVDLNVIDNISRTLTMSKADITEAFKRMKYYEELYSVAKLLYDAQRWFDDKTFMNPLSPHGLIIIGFIINTIAYSILVK